MNTIFTICIPTYENAEAFERAIDSLKKQTFTDWECMVGDDSSSDAIRKVVEKVADSRITYFRNNPKKGVPGNWNALITKASGAYVTLLHQDDFYVSDIILERAHAALTSSTSRFAVCAYSIFERDKVITHSTSTRHVRNFLHDFPARSLIVNRIGHPSVIFFQNDLKGVLFDEELCYFVDTDWYARLWKAGGEPAYLADAEIGVEKGSGPRLSQKCMRNFASIDAELEWALKKWGASPGKIATGFARLYASNIRHLSHTWAPLKMRVRSFSARQKGIFAFSFFLLLWHMGYRAFRKYVLRRPWA